jgi:hypothetical protein
MDALSQLSPSCGKENAKEATFCNCCGAALPEGQPPAHLSCQQPLQRPGWWKREKTGTKIGIAAVVALVVFGATMGGCEANRTATTTTTEMDPRIQQVMAAALPITWDELMAGAPTAKLLKVSGTIGTGGLGLGAGSIHVGGDPERLLFFEPMPVSDARDSDLPSVSMADFHAGELTVYGMASGEAGHVDVGADYVRMFYVVVVEYRTSLGTGQTATTGTEP